MTPYEAMDMDDEDYGSDTYQCIDCDEVFQNPLRCPEEGPGSGFYCQGCYPEIYEES